jgi:alpha-L-fucosidase
MYQASSIVIFTILYSAVNGLSCTYRFPAYHKPHTCLEYDLTMLSHYGPYNISSGDSISSGGYSTLYVKVCDFISTDFPDVCVSKFNSKSPATAYAYSNEGGCYPIGKLEYDFAYPLDPLDGSVGIRVAYTSKDDGNGVWSRGIIYDLYCDKSGVQYRPTFSYEYPEYTYRVTWHTGYACPSVLTGEKCNRPKFDSNWDSLRFRTHPSWFKRAKFGIFVVWGLYSVPAFMNEWYQKRLMEGVPEYVEFHNRVYGCSGVLPEKFPCTGPIFKFQDFAPMFKAELFDPDYLASVFKKSGAKYVVFTTKHHSGWTNFPSAQHWNYNSEDVGPHMDLTGNLTASVKAQGLYMGLYHSLREWFHPLYLQDQANNCTTTAFVDEILIPTLKDMVNRYKVFFTIM